MTTSPPLRGTVYMVDLGYGEKPWLVVSNNVRNRQLPTVLAVRLSTTTKPDLASIVKLSHIDKPLTGSVLCDEIAVLQRDWLKSSPGALAPSSLVRVGMALKVALGVE